MNGLDLSPKPAEARIPKHLREAAAYQGFDPDQKVTSVQLWTIALRSGLYEQARGYLRTTFDGGKVGYCCLGVACDMYLATHNGNARWHQYSGEMEFEVYDDFGRRVDGSPTTLPEPVAEWLGTDDSNPMVFLQPTELEGRHTLTHLNDSFRLNFKDIADVIQSNFVTPKEAP